MEVNIQLHDGTNHKLLSGALLWFNTLRVSTSNVGQLRSVSRHKQHHYLLFTMEHVFLTLYI